MFVSKSLESISAICLVHMFYYVGVQQQILKVGLKMFGIVSVCGAFADGNFNGMTNILFVIVHGLSREVILLLTLVIILFLCVQHHNWNGIKKKSLFSQFILFVVDVIWQRINLIIIRNVSKEWMLILSCYLQLLLHSVGFSFKLNPRCSSSNNSNK